MATALGSNPELLACEAIERFVDYDVWFISEVEKGIAATDCGDLIDHDDIRKQIIGRFPG